MTIASTWSRLVPLAVAFILLPLIVRASSTFAALVGPASDPASQRRQCRIGAPTKLLTLSGKAPCPSNYCLFSSSLAVLRMTEQRSDGDSERTDRSSSGLGLRGKIDEVRSNFAAAAAEGFGTRARNVAPTMSVGDVVVPLCGNLELRQELANRGVYAGVEYVVCGIALPLADGEEEEREVRSLGDCTDAERRSATAMIKPRYPLRPHLERTDWPVPVRPMQDVPLWLSRATWEAGTALGTLGLAFSYLSIAAVLALFVRFAYVPSESMIPALNPGDLVLVTRSLPVGPLKPKVGDVVLFDPPEELEKAVASTVMGQKGEAKSLAGSQLLKRVMAVEGEGVGVKRSEPYVYLDVEADSWVNHKDNEPGLSNPLKGQRKVRIDLVGPYASPEIFPPSSWDRPLPAEPLKQNEYFVAGDNGFRSVDSRVWGPLKGRYVFGTARWVLLPPAHFGPVEPGNIVTTQTTGGGGGGGVPPK